MFYIKIAELTVKINNKYDHCKNVCRDYIVEPQEQPDIDVSVSLEDIKREKEISPNATDGYVESICIYREICKRLPLITEAYLMHGAVVEYRGEGFMFLAKSGTGKSTHINLWKRVFGDEVRIINGDKPIMKFSDGKLWAYGTPWCGKEGWNINARTPIKALCFLERAEQNSIRRIDAAEAITRILVQVLNPTDVQTVDAFFPLLDRTLREVPLFVLGCNISPEAVRVAYDGMK